MRSCAILKFLLALTISFCFITISSLAIETKDLGTAKSCTCDEDGNSCELDGYVGSNVIYEDDDVRIWNFTLAPGEMTSMHRHDHDYHFVVIKPTTLEVFGEDGSRLFDFWAEDTLGFKVVGDFLEVQNGIDLPPVPRVHAAKNIGTEIYYEILFETKPKQQMDQRNTQEL